MEIFFTSPPRQGNLTHLYQAKACAVDYGKHARSFSFAGEEVTQGSWNLLGEGFGERGARQGSGRYGILGIWAQEGTPKVDQKNVAF